MTNYDDDRTSWAQPGDECPAHPGQCLEPVLSDSGPDPDVVGVYCPVCDDEEADHVALDRGEVPYEWLEASA